MSGSGKRGSPRTFSAGYWFTLQPAQAVGKEAPLALSDIGTSLGVRSSGKDARSSPCRGVEPAQLIAAYFPSLMTSIGSTGSPMEHLSKTAPGFLEFPKAADRNKGIQTRICSACRGKRERYSRICAKVSLLGFHSHCCASCLSMRFDVNAMLPGDPVRFLSLHTGETLRN